MQAEVSIGKGRTVRCDFLLVPIGSFDIILGMPFMVKARVTLDPPEQTATFKDIGQTIRCVRTWVRGSRLSGKLQVSWCVTEAEDYEPRIEAQTKDEDES